MHAIHCCPVLGWTWSRASPPPPGSLPMKRGHRLCATILQPLRFFLLHAFASDEVSVCARGLGGKYWDPGLAGHDPHVCKWSIVFNQLMEGNCSACMHMLAHCSGCRKIAAFAVMDINHKHALLPPLQILVKVCEPHRVLHNSSSGNIVNC